jgi:uncharacterized protein DUF4389
MFAPVYPVRVDGTLDRHLSRWLWLVKWFLAIPHYLVVGLFVGGTYAVWHSGLIGVLVLIAAVIVAVTGSYPEPVFDFVLGMNRWVLRVAAYAALMTDRYPPFRLDMGGTDPGGTLSLGITPEPCDIR